MSESQLHVDWSRLETLFRTTVESTFESRLDRDEAHYGHDFEFALSRFSEGRQLVDWFLSHFRERPIRVLDLGSGNGGASLALANHRSFDVTAADLIPNRHLLNIRGKAGLPLRYVLTDARMLPFDHESFHAVLSLETIEHIPQPERMGKEVMRVLRTGGLSMVTTAARVPHLLRPDPHFGIRGLLLLPDALQERVVRRLRPNIDEYDVEHMFWTAGGIARCFQGHSSVQTLVNIPYPGIPRTISQWTRRLLRRVMWDRILIWK